MFNMVPATTHPSAKGVTLRVLVAETGVTYRITLLPTELTVANLRAHLAAAIPPADQILLLGPPYKVPKDATLQSEEILNALRLGDIEDDLIPENTSSSVSQQQQQQQQQEQQCQQPQPQYTMTTRINPPAHQRSASADSKILAASERTGARRLFLFSKRSLSEASSSESAVCSLEPKEVKLPTEAPGPSPLNMDVSSSTGTLPPLHQALTAYERQFMLYLVQGHALADGADLRLAACRTCVQEQAVIARALRAAVSNLADHYHAATRTRAEFTASFQSKLARHSNMLQNFETNLTHLSHMSLHSSLISMARSSGRVMETLLDTVPVDKERSWSQQCALGHERLVALFGELENAFGELGTTASREEEAAKDREAEDEVQMLWNLVEGEMKQARDAQSHRLERLTADHSDVVKTIMHALDSENRNDDGVDDEQRTHAAFGPLGEKSKSSKDVIPAMIKDDATMKLIMDRVAEAKTRSMQRMKVRLKEISRTQSNIQRVLSYVAVVREAMNQHAENMAHLEHLTELPDSYRAFLFEIRRRRAYGQAVNSLSRAMVERLASMRTDEVRAREKFLRGPGRHLMPPFFDVFAPTLATPPPLFTPQMPSVVELDSLPDVGIVEDSNSAVGVGTVEMRDTAGLVDTEMHPVAAETGGVSTASSLTVESHPISGGGGNAGQQQPQQQQSSSQQASASGTDPMISSTLGRGGVGRPPEQIPEEENDGQPDQPQAQDAKQLQQDQLIVSADENSGDDMLFDPTEGAAVEAEAKTLAYENAILRQTIERLGGKPPRAYLEEAAAATTTAANRNAKDSPRPNDDSKAAAAAAAMEIAALRKQLAEANAKSAVLKKSLKRAESEMVKLAAGDKISHRSFDVGDVGLFMLASRGGGKDGKPRTYLAFHTNCPHRYLSRDCVTGEPNFVVGRILHQQEWTATTPGVTTTDGNPYGLPAGTKFWVVTVEVMSSY